MKTNPKKILIIDDNLSIHEDFHKILGKKKPGKQRVNEIEKELFGTQEETPKNDNNDYIIESAYQGEEGLELIKKAYKNNDPYALAFIDIRMPPGWDGLLTVERIAEVDPDLQIVICTAYSDYSWKEIIQKLQHPSNLLILKKPFEIIEIRQLAASLTLKWELIRQVRFQINNLNSIVQKRTADLEETLSLTQATLESIPGGIIAINTHQKIMIYNQLFMEIWQIDEPIPQFLEATELLPRLAKQVEAPEVFLKTLNSLIGQPKVMSKGVKEYKFNSGKVVELYAQPQYLHDKVVGIVFCFQDISVRKKLEEQLLFQATHDGLTALPNRILLADRLQQAVAHAKRESTIVGVLIFDLDNFKEINDSMGHGSGDTLLKLVAERIKNNIRDVDTIVRLGGDEFVVILVSQNNKNTTILKIKDLLALLNMPYQINENAFTVTASIGVSFYPDDGQEINTLLKNADAALSRAKDTGRNTFQVYIPEFNEQLLQRVKLLSALRKACEKKELVLHYQPLVASDSGQILGLEALIRWQHPKMGLIYPQLFIPMAEESGLIVSIGAWVLKAACEQTKKWQRTINPNLSVAVNISGYQLIQKDFVEIVKRALDETEFNPKLLELEMTESHIFTNVPETVNKMKQLKELGVRLSIDDFGTGYASFSYLKYFPFDKVKIDKSFIQGIHIDKNDDAIVEAIINMTRKMGIEVLAEGVEKPEQIAFLMSHHGNQMQGYYYGKPMDVQKITDFLIKSFAAGILIKPPIEE